MSEPALTLGPAALPTAAPEAPPTAASTAAPSAAPEGAARPKPRVVIVGCGFGGLSAARALRSAPVDVLVVDRRNHHLFQPLLYQVATGGLSAPAIASPIRYVLRRQRNATTLLAEVESIDVQARCLRTDAGPVPYDHLILAAGATSTWFGQDAWAAHAPALKTLSDALDIRDRVLGGFERAETAQDDAARTAWLTFVVVGGGPTGVELAGTLAEIARHSLEGEFRRVDPRRARVVLVEGGPRVLGTFDERSSESAHRQLERLGVEVRAGCKVQAIDAEGIEFTAPDGQAQRLAARTVLWAAGVRASPLGASLPAGLDRGGRVPVRPDLSLDGHDEVFVVGDLANVAEHRPPVPGVAPAAKQMGRHAARNVLRRLRGQATQPFRYVDWGALATIGRNSAVAEIGRLRLSGYPAWLFWLVAHVFFLIGFRNRVVVMLDWAWSYVTFARFSRIIGEPPTDQRAAAP